MSDTKLCFVSQDGADSFLLFGTTLYRMRAGDERPYELALDHEISNPQAGEFVFTDSMQPGEEQGVLLHDGNTCTVRTSWMRDTPYFVSAMPENLGTPQRLYEFDFRQKPALMLSGRDTNALIYLSRATYLPEEDKPHFSRMFMVTVNADRHPLDIRDFGKLTDVTTRYPHAPRTLQVEHSPHYLHLMPQRVMDTGDWGEMPGIVLEKIPLSGFTVRHRRDGSIYMFGPRG